MLQEMPRSLAESAAADHRATARGSRTSVDCPSLQAGQQAHKCKAASLYAMQAPYDDLSTKSCMIRRHHVLSKETVWVRAMFIPFECGECGSPAKKNRHDTSSRPNSTKLAFCVQYRMHIRDRAVDRSPMSVLLRTLYAVCARMRERALPLAICLYPWRS